MTSHQSWPTIFFGSETNSLLVLKKIARFPYLKIKAVVSPPPQPQGRKRTLLPTPVHQWAQKHNFKVFTPAQIDPPFLATIKKIQPALGILVAYGKIIPPSLIHAFPKGIINIHPSYLPQWRGPTPIENAILSGASQTGVSLILIDEKIDHGPILAQKREKILPLDNQLTLGKRLFNQGAALLAKTLPFYLNHRLKPSPQNHHRATFTKKLTRQDGFIPRSQLIKALRGEKEALLIERKIRAFYPWPGTYTLVGNPPAKKRLKIIRAHLGPSSQLILDQIQLEGKKILDSPLAISPLLKRYQLLP